MDFAELFTGAALLSLFTLTLMEIILGVDNIVFISIVAGKLPAEQQPRARTIGLMLAMFIRVALLAAIKWLVGLTAPLFTLAIGELFTPIDVSFKDLILMAGGLFLIGKSVTEMHHKLEGDDEDDVQVKARSFVNVILQILIIDIVFSFDSILTAIGLAEQLPVMIIAVVISMILMMIFSGTISDFINKRPTVKMLALAFLILIGVMLVIESLHQHVDKGYIYFAMAFSLVVELLNNRIRKPEDPVKLRSRFEEDKLGAGK